MLWAGLIPVMVGRPHGGEWLVDPHWVVWMSSWDRLLLLLIVKDCPGCLPGLGCVRHTAQGPWQWSHAPGIVHLAPVPVFPLLKHTVGHVWVVGMICSILLLRMPAIDAFLAEELTIVALVIVILATRVLTIETRVLTVLTWVALVRVGQTGPALTGRVLRDRGRGSVSRGAN